ncbi:6545_t:CDS:2 [Ambispora gerdemannii]|uniref:6545_t:CDS:1 n=1 Tax=Ambispora gerdemannii TaxID=144530 RepID=A0A9N8VRK1_9GLOM|nr:6545_t:CDS:2 [Ambispora gerdemannii]
MNFSSLLGNNTKQNLSSEIISKTNEVLEAYKIARDVYKQAGKALRNAATKVDELSQLLPDDMCIQLPKELLYGLPSSKKLSAQTPSFHKTNTAFSLPFVRKRGKKSRRHRRRQLTKNMRTSIIESEADEFDDIMSDYHKDSSSNEMELSDLEYIDGSEEEKSESSISQTLTIDRDILPMIASEIDSKTDESKKRTLEPPTSNFTTPNLRLDISYGLTSSRPKSSELPKCDYYMIDIDMTNKPDKLQSNDSQLSPPISENSSQMLPKMKDRKNALYVNELNVVKKRSGSATNKFNALTKPRQGASNKVKRRYDPYPSSRKQSFENVKSTSANIGNFPSYPHNIFNESPSHLDSPENSQATSPTATPITTPTTTPITTPITTPTTTTTTTGPHATLHSFFLNGLPHQSADASNWFQEVTKHTYTPQPLSDEDNALIDEFIRYAGPRLKNPRCTQSEIAREIILLSNNTCKMSQGSVSTMMRRISVPKPATTRRAIQNWIDNEKTKKEQEKLNLMWKTTNNNWK